MTEASMLLDDVHDKALLSNVKPGGWKNPTADGKYNLVVIGGGTAGLVTAAGAAGVGARVALIEKNMMGGDCLNVGCVPSKALIRASRAAAAVREAKEYGVNLPGEPTVDFKFVMERLRKLRAQISPNDGAERFKKLGVDVYLGKAAFTGPDTLEVNGQKLAFSKAVIATGARATVPPVPGLADAGPLTNENLFTLTELPKRLAIIGAGPIGCEMAQAFQRLGSKVTVLEMAPQILIREDKDAAEIIQAALNKDGVETLLSVKLTGVRKSGSEKIVSFEWKGEKKEQAFDHVLVGAGRAPNVEGLGLDVAGVQFDKMGVKVDDTLRTSNPRILAAGDICSVYKFTHTADAMARIAIRNALFMGQEKMSALTIPWCTYTDPEIAHVGMYEKEAKDKGYEVKTFSYNLNEVDRAILDGETAGFAKVHVRAGTDEILGATLVSRHAGESISELTLAMVGKLGLGTIAKTIHCYPTQAEAIKRVGDAYSRTRLTATVKKVFDYWLSWSR